MPSLYSISFTSSARSVSCYVYSFSRTYHSCAWRMLFLKTCQLCSADSLFRVAFHWIPPISSLNKPKVCSLEVQGLYFATHLSHLHQDLKCHYLIPEQIFNKIIIFTEQPIGKSPPLREPGLIAGPAQHPQSKFWKFCKDCTFTWTRETEHKWLGETAVCNYEVFPHTE